MSQMSIDDFLDELTIKIDSIKYDIDIENDVMIYNDEFFIISKDYFYSMNDNTILEQIWKHSSFKIDNLTFLGTTDAINFSTINIKKLSTCNNACNIYVKLDISKFNSHDSGYTFFGILSPYVIKLNKIIYFISRFNNGWYFFSSDSTIDIMMLRNRNNMEIIENLNLENMTIYSTTFLQLPTLLSRNDIPEFKIVRRFNTQDRVFLKIQIIFGIAHDQNFKYINIFNKAIISNYKPIYNVTVPVTITFTERMSEIVATAPYQLIEYGGVFYVKDLGNYKLELDICNIVTNNLANSVKTFLTPIQWHSHPLIQESLLSMPSNTDLKGNMVLEPITSLLFSDSFIYTYAPSSYFFIILDYTKANYPNYYELLVDYASNLFYEFIMMLNLEFIEILESERKGLTLSNTMDMFRYIVKLRNFLSKKMPFHELTITNFYDYLKSRDVELLNYLSSLHFNQTNVSIFSIQIFDKQECFDFKSKRFILVNVPMPLPFFQNDKFTRPNQLNCRSKTYLQIDKNEEEIRPPTLVNFISNYIK